MINLFGLRRGTAVSPLRCAPVEMTKGRWSTYRNVGWPKNKCRFLHYALHAPVGMINLFSFRVWGRTAIRKVWRRGREAAFVALVAWSVEQQIPPLRAARSGRDDKVLAGRGGWVPEQVRNCRSLHCGRDDKGEVGYLPERLRPEIDANPIFDFALSKISHSQTDLHPSQDSGQALRCALILRPSGLHRGGLCAVPPGLHAVSYD